MYERSLRRRRTEIPSLSFLKPCVTRDSTIVTRKFFATEFFIGFFSFLSLSKIKISLEMPFARYFFNRFNSTV